MSNEETNATAQHQSSMGEAKDSDRGQLQEHEHAPEDKGLGTPIVVDSGALVRIASDLALMFVQFLM